MLGSFFSLMSLASLNDSDTFFSSFIFSRTRLWFLHSLCLCVCIKNVQSRLWRKICEKELEVTSFHSSSCFSHFLLKSASFASNTFRRESFCVNNQRLIFIPCSQTYTKEKDDDLLRYWKKIEINNTLANFGCWNSLTFSGTVINFEAISTNPRCFINTAMHWYLVFSASALFRRCRAFTSKLKNKMWVSNNKAD